MRSREMLSKCVSGGMTTFMTVIISLSLQTHAQVQNTTLPLTVPSTSPMDSSMSLLPTQPITPFPTEPVPTMPVTTTSLQTTTPDDSPMETCCYVQSACDRCKNLYKVNSITYCCPNCLGLVLVTDLRCLCYSMGLTNVTLNCTKSKEVVGGYLPLKPAYYSVGASAIKASPVFSLAMVVIVSVWKDKRRD